MALRAAAHINLAAIERNVARLRRELPTGGKLSAVVKADGYGHGAVPAARAALAGGAESLAVATAEEAQSLRRAGLPGRILVMGAVSGQELRAALEADADMVCWSERFAQEVHAAAGSERRVQMHVKLDTGMGRLGTREPAQALRVAQAIAESGSALELVGAMTHFATADGDQEFVERQLELFTPFVETIRERYPGIVVHAANSAATLRMAASHFDMVRCGIAIYGCDPMNEDPSAVGLEPALRLTTYVAAVKLARVGESAGYGRRFIAARETRLATLPIGYADGIRRALTNNCDVLIGGRRYPLVGTVSMDNVTVDVGHDARVGVGDEAVLIGSGGDQRQTVEDLARRIGTINYEIVCGISQRVPRFYHRDGAPAADG